MIGYFDCIGGASGDMILGALLDAGLDLRDLEADLAGLAVGGYRIVASRARRGPLAASRVEVVTSPAPGGAAVAERPLAEVLGVIDRSNLPAAVKTAARKAFTALAAAEGHIHGTAPEDVGLHEVGDVDALVDVVGSIAGLHRLGIDKVFCSPMPMGSGTVQCRHGALPVPAPAVLELLRGVPVRAGEPGVEQVTPTAAAILATVAQGFGPMPDMVPRATGYGAGARAGGTVPNVLRLVIGEPWDATHPEAGGSGARREERQVTVIEANIDDMNPQFYEDVTGRLLQAGALDAYVVPLLMKRGRPAAMLGVIAPPSLAETLADLVLTHTTTLGLRMFPADRRIVDRETRQVTTPYGVVGVKVGRRGGCIVNISPEYEDCRRLAEESGVPVKEVHDAARAAARAELLGRDGPRG